MGTGMGRGVNSKINRVRVLFSSAIAEGSSQQGCGSFGFGSFLSFHHRVLWDVHTAHTATVPFPLLESLGSYQEIRVST